MDPVMNNILHLTSILPAPINVKLHENDILLRLAQEYEKKYPDSKHHFIYVTPYSNWLLALFNKKWRDYRKIIRKGTFDADGYQVLVMGIPMYKNDLRFSRLLTWFGFTLFNKRIREKIEQIKPDIIHAHNMHSNIEIAELIKKRYGVNYIVTARSIEKRILNRMHRGYLNPSSILSHNHISAKRCKDLGIPLNIIPHPLDEVFLKCDPPTAVKHEDLLKIVSICSLVKLKNIDKVIKALYHTRLEFCFTIFGDGPEKENLKNLVQSLNLEDRIIFEGYKPHPILAHQLPSFDLFIMPSFPETLGRVYFEAMACGVPVVASKNTGIDGMIEHGVHGYIADSCDINSIEKAIFHFAALSLEHKLQMKIEAYTFARQFTWESVLQKYHELYNA